MADRKQSSEFLGGGPKFNSVGRDTRAGKGAEETDTTVRPVNQSGYWTRIAGTLLAVLLLTALLFYLNDQNLGRTTVHPTRGGHAVSLDTAKPTTDPNLK